MAALSANLSWFLLAISALVILSLLVQAREKPWNMRKLVCKEQQEGSEPKGGENRIDDEYLDVVRDGPQDDNPKLVCVAGRQLCLEADPQRQATRPAVGLQRRRNIRGQKWIYLARSGFIQSSLQPDKCLGPVTTGGQQIGFVACDKFARWDLAGRKLRWRAQSNRCLGTSGQEPVLGQCRDNEGSQEIDLRNPTSGLPIDGSYKKIVLWKGHWCLGAYPDAGVAIYSCRDGPAEKWTYDRTSGFIRTMARPTECLRNEPTGDPNRGTVLIGPCDKRAVWDLSGSTLRPKEQPALCLDNEMSRELDKNPVISFSCSLGNPEAQAWDWRSDAREMSDIVAGSGQATNGTLKTIVPIEDESFCLEPGAKIAKCQQDNQNQLWSFDSRNGFLKNQNRCLRFSPTHDLFSGHLVLGDCDKLARWDVDGEQIRLRIYPAMCFDIWEAKFESSQRVIAWPCTYDQGGHNGNRAQRWRLLDLQEAQQGSDVELQAKAKAKAG